jgi:hypothetical protein
MRFSLFVLAALSIPTALHAEGSAVASAPDAAVTSVTSTAVPAALPDRLDPNVFRCGPVLAKDAATRTRIEQLYREQFDLRQGTMARLKDLASRAKSETDHAALLELSKQGGQLKKDLERRNMELGLEIARLNGDAPRVAEYERALDQLLHPEKYMPVLKPDPEAQARRLRAIEESK